MFKKIILILFISLNVYSQNISAKLDSIINNHVMELRKSIGKDVTIFLSFNYDISTEHLSNKDFIIKNNIDPKNLKKNTSYYLINFIIYDDKGRLKLKGINFHLKKINNKESYLSNLGNGNIYDLNL
jgi:hypothetical protein